jgi:hypothetical protein
LRAAFSASTHANLPQAIENIYHFGFVLPKLAYIAINAVQLTP